MNGIPNDDDADAVDRKQHDIPKDTTTTTATEATTTTTSQKKLFPLNLQISRLRTLNLW